MTGHDIAKPWAVFDATLSGWAQSYERNCAYLDEVPVILTALPQQRWRVYLQPSAPGSDFLVDAASTIRRYRSEIRFNDVTNPCHFHCHSKVATKFRAGRILLAGDAAHVCSPSQGHGMNSGLQDAFNLAWKLALVCKGRCPPTLLDSYDVERRPVAEAVAASGDAFEQALGMTIASEREIRNKKLRAVFADPAARHQEAVAEAELDINYSSSPIVMGDVNESLPPGDRLPDTIRTYLDDIEAPLLHELCNRTGHTALIIGSESAPVEQLRQLERTIRSQGDTSLIESTSSLTSRSDNQGEHKRIMPAAARQLGVGGFTLLVIRPDGYVGLRADHDHLKALASYQAMLLSG
jgi:hypothetical protein